MLLKVEVITEGGSLLSLPLQDASGGYIVEEIEGLDPVKTTVSTSSFATLDGTQYQASRREARNVVMKLGYEPNYAIGESVQTLRSRLYGFLMPKSFVKLRFYISTGLTVDIDGMVESFETSLFSKTPQVSISIICFDSDFYDPTPITVNMLASPPGVGVTDSINYTGTIETGVLVSFKANRALNGFTIVHNDIKRVGEVLTYVGPLVNGNVVNINTNPGKKSASLSGGGSVLHRLSPESTWFRLHRGNNTFSGLVTTAGTSVPYTVTYINKYGGL